ncbi:hypothetical protein [Pseudonocardia sp. NPDC046786]|uniref:hypothetical protein n=1 Tax=Pseudonocardia sp. NPDC046786 TaxID=3155471 RepID=UPI0033D82104
MAAHGLAAVVERARETGAGFSADAAVGPWAPVLRSDDEFARRYAELDPTRYRTVVDGIARTMFDRDSVPGPEPEDLLSLDVPALVVAGQDHSHTRSAAWFLHECLDGSQLWDVPVAEQTAQTAPARVVEFLGSLPG